MDILYTIILRDYTTGMITQVEVTKPVFDEYRQGIRKAFSQAYKDDYIETNRISTSGFNAN